MNTVIICAGGPLTEVADLTSYKSGDIVFIGADKGSMHLMEQGINPDVAVGDFDSLSSEEFTVLSKKVNVLKIAPAEKDETDTDLALSQALEYNPVRILLTGVTGGRLDHFMAVLNSVFRFQMDNPEIQFTILNKWNEMMLLTPGTTKISKHPFFRYVSFFAFQGKVEHVSLTGMKYNVDNETIEMGDSRFTSNEVLYEEGSISFSPGICLLIRSSDE
jgi:thiamine pyrophosphokinase